MNGVCASSTATTAKGSSCRGTHGVLKEYSQGTHGYSRVLKGYSDDAHRRHHRQGLVLQGYKTQGAPWSALPGRSPSDRGRGEPNHFISAQRWAGASPTGQCPCSRGLTPAQRVGSPRDVKSQECNERPRQRVLTGYSENFTAARQPCKGLYAVTRVL